MPQNLIQFPLETDFIIGGVWIRIRDHKIVERSGLLDRIMAINTMHFNDGQTLYQFEKYGVSFEAAIEYCVGEIETELTILAHIIHWQYLVWIETMPDEESNLTALFDFSKGVTGRAIADMFTEKIRSCDNWDQLYDELHYESKFHKDMERKIVGAIKQR